jgi:hypothetical protein
MAGSSRSRGVHLLPGFELSRRTRERFIDSAFVIQGRMPIGMPEFQTANVLAYQSKISTASCCGHDSAPAIVTL